MSAILVTWARTLGRARNLYSTAFTLAAFLSASAAVLIWQLVATNGLQLPLAVAWATSVAPVLPLLAALLAMDGWSEERSSGRWELLLTVPVREREFTLGKFLGIWSMGVAATLVSAAVTLIVLRVASPETLSGTRLLQFVPAGLMLALQLALWTSVSLAMSALTGRQTIAFVVTVLLTAVLPRGGWFALRELSSAGRLAFGEFPLDAQVTDAALGWGSAAMLCFYVLGTAATLLFTAKLVESWRYAGKRGRGRRWLCRAVGVLAVVFAALATVVVGRFRLSFEVPVTGLVKTLSNRTRDILRETAGTIVVSVYLPKSDARFRPVSHLLRTLKREAAAHGGARIELEYVDPNWDLTAAERLVRRGVTDCGLVFARGRRTLTLPASEGLDERRCASAIRRLVTSPARRNIYWTRGHGEFSFGDYTPFGLSDIARELQYEGYRNAALDLASTAAVPGDCALVAIAGAKNAFSRVETDRLEAYLKDGGRLLILADAATESGVNSQLPAWGMRPIRPTAAGVETHSGTDVIVSEFAAHPVTAALAGSRLVFERPLAFEPSVATSTGAEKINFTPLASVGKQALAASVERGAGVGTDLAIRPTRLVAVGDATFLLNGQLAIRGNANRDFILNAVSWLSGVEPAGSSGDENDWLRLCPDRAGRRRVVVLSVVVAPFLCWLLLMGITRHRRNRS